MSLLSSFFTFIMDILETIVFIGSIFIVIYLFILSPNQVKGQSMEPNFESGDYIFTSKFIYKFKPPQRGDVVVVKAPSNPDIEYIKRIIGLPGDVLEIRNGLVYVNNVQLPESYLNQDTNVWEGGPIQENTPFKVPEGDIFIMGDNRHRSSDSREFGPVPEDSIIGEVFFRYLPINKLGSIRNPLPSSFRSTANVIPMRTIALAIR